MITIFLLKLNSHTTVLIWNTKQNWINLRKLLFLQYKKKWVLKYLNENIDHCYYLVLVPRLVGDVFRFPPCVLRFPLFDPDIVWEFDGGGKKTDRKLGSAISIQYGLYKDCDWELSLVIWILDAVQTGFFREIFDVLSISSSLKVMISLSSLLSSCCWIEV